MREAAGYRHRGDCWAHRPVHNRFHKHHHHHHSFVQQPATPIANNKMALPGAGMVPDDIQPFQTVTKDGFLMTECVKDAMLEHGDKFGNNRHSYKMEDVANVSIVHYAEIIPKEDREKMSIDLCFDFCRTVPNMVYFGLNAGRDCYCMPYYKAMPGDSSNCDEVCEGEPSQMCGGMVRSSVFEMHTCADTLSDLEDVTTKVEDVIFLHLQDLANHLKDVADEGTSDATSLQEIFGLAGGIEVSTYMQDAKVYAGELLDSVAKAQKLIDAMQDPYDAAQRSMSRNLQNFENIKVAEDAIKALKEGLTEAEERKYEMKNYMKVAHPVSLMGEEGYNATEASLQYYPIMYFADKEFQTRFVVEGFTMWQHPTTCTGGFIQIVFGGVMDDCAHACDQYPGKCDGFQFMDFNDGMCILFESIKTVQVWEGCNRDDAPAPFMVQCVGKLSRLEGVGGIAPRKDKVLEEARKIRQGTGKCAHCLESLDKFGRCYEYGVKCIGNEHDWESYIDMYWTSASQNPDNLHGCERLAKQYPGWCMWEWGRPGYWDGSGQWLRSSQVCPQCGYCLSNGKSAGNPSIPWQNENWEGDNINVYYYY